MQFVQPPDDHAGSPADITATDGFAPRNLRKRSRRFAPPALSSKQICSRSCAFNSSKAT